MTKLPFSGIELLNMAIYKSDAIFFFPENKSPKFKSTQIIQYYIWIDINQILFFFLIIFFKTKFSLSLHHSRTSLSLTSKNFLKKSNIFDLIPKKMKFMLCFSSSHVLGREKKNKKKKSLQFFHWWWLWWHFCH